MLSLLWLATVQRVDWRTGVSVLAVLVAGVAVRSALKNLPTGQLVWDGMAWRWESAGYQTGIAEYEVAVVADLQSRLLLRLENPAKASLWLWLERSALPERWLDLRRAVYATRRSVPSALAHDLLPPSVAGSEPISSAFGPLSKP